jgi:hypothetical protein
MDNTTLLSFLNAKLLFRIFKRLGPQVSFFIDQFYLFFSSKNLAKKKLKISNIDREQLLKICASTKDKLETAK